MRSPTSAPTAAAIHRLFLSKATTRAKAAAAKKAIPGVIDSDTYLLWRISPGGLPRKKDRANSLAFSIVIGGTRVQKIPAATVNIENKAESRRRPVIRSAIRKRNPEAIAGNRK